MESFHAELKFCLSILLQASVLSLDLPANQITMSKSVFSCAEREQRAASRRGGAHRGSQMPGRMHGVLLLTCSFKRVLALSADSRAHREAIPA